MHTPLVYIALGSNIEPRAARLAQARSLLEAIAEGDWAESEIRETTPVGPQDQGLFLNQVVCFRSKRSPLALLDFCKGAELILGRKPRGHWQARELDLDLLYAGNEIISSEHGLQLPHPRIAERGFVLEPLCDLAPDHVHPVTQKTNRSMLAELLTQGKAA